MSPSWKIGTYRLSFSSHDRNEPPHVHVESERGSAKFWLEPVEIATVFGFSERDLREIAGMIEENREWLLSEREEFWRNA